MEEEVNQDEKTAFSPLRSEDFIQQLSVDCVIVGYNDQRLKILVPQLELSGNYWVLPSGFIHQEESVDEAAKRIFEDRTGIKDYYLEQFRVFGNKDRTNKEFFEQMISLNRKKFKSKADWEWITRRFVSVGYLALVDMSRVKLKKSNFDKSIKWFDIDDLPEMIMDHNIVVEEGLKALRINFEEKQLAFYLLRNNFTMKEIQELYEAVYQKTYSRSNFQKKMLDLQILERLKKKYTGAANKAPYLYKLKKNSAQ